MPTGAFSARLRFLFATLAVAVLTFVVLGGFQLWNVLFGAQNLTTADGSVHPPNVVVADLLEFVVPSRYNAGGLPFRSIARNFTATGAEMNAYVGLPLLIVLGVIVVRHRRSCTVQIAAVLTGVMALLSMGPRLHIAGTSTVPLPWDLFARLPLLGHLLPARLAVFTDLGIAVLLAYGIGNRVRPATDRQRAIRAIACVAVVGSLLPSATLLGRLSDPVVTPAYFTTSAVKRIPDGSVALVAPWTTDGRNDAPEVWQALSHFRFRMPSGYAYVPDPDGGVRTGVHDLLLERALYRMGFGHDPRVDPSDAGTRAELLRDLRRLEVGTVVVGPMDHRDLVLDFLTTLLERRPERAGGVYVWYGVGRATAAR